MQGAQSQMTAKLKFQLDLIEQAHRALDALPQHQPQEFTKAQAIQKLIGSIRAVQAKGYSLTAIAKVVSDIGIPVTPGALRLYASGGKTATSTKKKANARRTDKQPAAARSGTPTSTPNAAPAQLVAPSAKPVADSRSVDLGGEPAARSAKTAPSQAGSHPAGFAVRPDTRDI
jgi:hypothetical protein